MRLKHGAVAVVGTAVGVTAFAQPAAAGVMSQFIWGSNPNVASPAQANVVGFWQELLIAATNVYQCGGLIQADGIFGNITTANTKAWQHTLGVTQDGIVGPNTWNGSMFYIRPDGRAALIPAVGGFYNYYTGGDAVADMYYGSAWKSSNDGTWYSTDYGFLNIDSAHHDKFSCG